MFGKGKMRISLPRSHYLPGEIIAGDIQLELKKPVQARQVSVALIGEQRTSRSRDVTFGSGYRTSSTTETTRIYEFTQTLDGEREYSGRGDYHFEMKIPADILDPQPEGVLKTLQTVATLVGAIPYRRLKWYLEAKLDIPGGLDVSKHADITIG